MKSGVMSVSSMALSTARTSKRWPTHSLMPTGLPPDSSRSLAMKCIISIGVEKAEWRDGETQSLVRSIRRVRAISGVILALGRTPP